MVRVINLELGKCQDQGQGLVNVNFTNKVNGRVRIKDRFSVELLLGLELYLGFG